MVKMRSLRIASWDRFEAGLGTSKRASGSSPGNPQNLLPEGGFQGTSKTVKTGFLRKAVFSASDEKEPHSYKGISAAFSFVAGLVQNAI